MLVELHSSSETHGRHLLASVSYNIGVHCFSHLVKECILSLVLFDVYVLKIDFSVCIFTFVMSLASGCVKIFYKREYINGKTHTKHIQRQNILVIPQSFII